MKEQKEQDATRNIRRFHLQGALLVLAYTVCFSTQRLVA
jgi:hypothetical protein